MQCFLSSLTAWCHIGGVGFLLALGAAPAHGQTEKGSLKELFSPPRPAPSLPSDVGKRASPPEARPPDKRPLPSGMYGLQELIAFDALEGAEYDTARKTLTLFGRRARADRLLRIPYLDHLAAAWEANAPTLSLKWTKASSLEIEEANRNSDSFFNIYEPGSRRINRLGAWLFAQGGVSVSAGTNIDDVGELVEKRGGLERIFRGVGPLHVPANLVPIAFKAVPRAVPEVKGMPVRSMMTKVALEADVQAKTIIEMPGLKGKLVGYLPYSDWERTHGSVGGQQHIWISTGKFELQETPDGTRVRFVRTPMQFNMQKYVADKSTPDPILAGYAQLLTRHYDGFAEEFPILHELREVAKVMALRSWLKRHRWQVAFPREGRADWSLPAEVPGVVHMIVNVRASERASLSIKSVMWQTGGIDLRVDTLASVSKANFGRHVCGAAPGTPFFGSPANPSGVSLVCGGGDEPAGIAPSPGAKAPPVVPPKPPRVGGPPMPSAPGPGPIPRSPLLGLAVAMAPRAAAEPVAPPKPPAPAVAGTPTPKCEGKANCREIDCDGHKGTISGWIPNTPKFKHPVVAIQFAGTQPAGANWIQFMWTQIFVRKTAGGVRALDPLIPYASLAGILHYRVHPTVDPAHPKYLVDNLNKVKHLPFYDGINVRDPSYFKIFDEPQSAIRLYHEEAFRDPNVYEMEQKIYFDDFLVSRSGKVCGKVTWMATFSQNREKNRPHDNVAYKVVGADASAVPNEAQMAQLKKQYPEFELRR